MVHRGYKENKVNREKEKEGIEFILRNKDLVKLIASFLDKSLWLDLANQYTSWPDKFINLTTPINFLDKNEIKILGENSDNDTLPEFDS